jgi:hypothetical protein
MGLAFEKLRRQNPFTAGVAQIAVSLIGFGNQFQDWLCLNRSSGYFHMPKNRPFPKALRASIMATDRSH